jgi:hypothetical protein
VGLATAGGLAEIAAGVLGTAATWVASTGSRAAGGEARAPRLVGACERQSVLGGVPGYRYAASHLMQKRSSLPWSVESCQRAPAYFGSGAHHPQRGASEGCISQQLCTSLSILTIP